MTFTSKFIDGSDATEYQKAIAPIPSEVADTVSEVDELPNDTRRIQVGDRVRCIDASASFHRLAEGAIYTVEAAYDGTPTVIVANSYHSIERFKLAA